MILLDTNICIAAIRDKRRVISRMAQYQGRLYLGDEVMKAFAVA